MVIRLNRTPSCVITHKTANSQSRLPDLDIRRLSDFDCSPPSFEARHNLMNPT